MRKNVSSQHVGAVLVSATDGSAVTSGTTAVYVSGDGGAQATSGNATHKGNGQWDYAPTQAETNYSHVIFTFVNAAAVNAAVQVYTISYDPHDTVHLGITSLPNAAANAANGLLTFGSASGQINPSSGNLTVAGYASGQAPLQPTTAGRTLDVSATGEAGLDFDNIKDATGAHTLTNITVPTVTSITNPVTAGTVSDKTGYSLAASQSFSTTGAVGSVTNNVGGNVNGNVVGSVASVTGNVGGNVTGSIGSLAAQAKTDVNDQVLDVLSVDTQAELPQGQPSATAPLSKQINLLYLALRNKQTSTAAGINIYNSSGTVITKAATSDDGTTYIRNALVSGP